jgi:hypothetical protein
VGADIWIEEVGDTVVTTIRETLAMKKNATR